jgi:hypothetical protein
MDPKSPLPPEEGITKEKVIALLKAPEFERLQETLKGVPARKVLPILLSSLCSRDEMTKWHAVTATGILVADLAERDPEGAREILRRMIWTLNEESGGIGWGIPEAMGEALARSETLAREFGPILLAYIQKDGNYLEFELLQRGALWAIGRLAEAYPRMLQSLGAVDALNSFLDSTDSQVRGQALWALGFLGQGGGLINRKDLLRDEAEVGIYQDQKFKRVTISELARRALTSGHGS